IKYAGARSRSIVFEPYCGILHSNVVSGSCAERGRLICTLEPVDLTYGVSTRPARAVAQRRASGPPPVSRARWSPVRLSYQRGLITQLYFPPSRSRFCGAGIVVWFHGCRLSIGLPIGSRSTNFASFAQSS